MTKIILLAPLFAVMLFGVNGYSKKSEWLIDVNDTNKRFEAIQTQFRGFDTAMMEVGYRYEQTKQAISKQNYKLAEYHWDKLKVTTENGYIRRPARKDAAELFLLNGAWKDLKLALSKGNTKAIEASFSQIKPTCNACHENQKVDFIVVE